MNIRNGRKESLTGFTLIELIMVIVILSILAGVAIPRMLDMGVVRLDMAARKIQSDIRYVQSLAVSIQKRTRIDFSISQDEYSLYLENSPGNWNLISNPLTKDNFTVELNSGDFRGIDITISYFNADNNALVFDMWGNPYGYDINTGSSSPLNNPARVRLVSGSDLKDIRVERGTGRVYIE